MPTFCTIVSPATIAAARVMSVSARQHHPQARVVAAIAQGAILNAEEPFEPLRADPPLSIPELLSAVLSEDGPAVYLNPVALVCDSLEPVLACAAEHGVALVRRLSQLPEDGKRPDRADLLTVGSISGSLVAVSASGAAAAFLKWWSEGRHEAERRGATPGDDGRWLELAAQRFPSAVVLDDAGCEVSYWNLHERPLQRHGDALLAAGRPVRTFQFAGFRPDRPYWLSENATRASVVDDDVLAELCGAYAARLREAGWHQPTPQIAGIPRLGNGQRVDPFLEVLWREAYARGSDFGDPLSAEAADAFVAWAREPAERGAAAGVNRYLMAAYLARADLQTAFPSLDGSDGDEFVRWGWDHAGDDVLAELLPSAPGQITLASSARVATNVIGYLGETLGLAEAARLYVQALQAVDIPVSTTAVTPDLPVSETQKSIARTGSRDWEDLTPGTAPVFNLACLNGDHLHQLIRTRGEGVLAGRPTIGQWGWETDVLPSSWIEAFSYVNEVWVYSRFMAENLGRLLPMPVVVVPPPIVTPDSRAVNIGIAPDDRFTFLFMIDLFSTLERKNPIGLIDAFTRAFAPDEGPRLLIKTINASFREQAADELRFRAGGRSDIEFIDGYLQPPEKAALLSRADCYVSLHRSEGFGLPLAESMSVGTPVIATGYSGNLDFMTPFNSYLVDWRPTRVGPGSQVYPAQGSWAEPELDHAAAQMRRVWEHPDEARERAGRAQADIQRFYAPRVVGEIARARLERLLDAEQKSEADSQVAAYELDELQEALSFDLRSGSPRSATGAASLMRRFALRLMLPFTHHQREVDRAVLSALRELRRSLERAQQRSRRDRRRLSRVEAALAQAQSHAPADPNVK
jgi:glycosyltransferase involved in cell wall biosynthesis